MCFDETKAVPEVEEEVTEAQTSEVEDLDETEEVEESVEAGYVSDEQFRAALAELVQRAFSAPKNEYAVFELVDHRESCGAIHSENLSGTLASREEALAQVIDLQKANPGSVYAIGVRAAR